MAKNTKKLPLVTHTFTFTTIHLKHDRLTHICTNISHTHTTTYAHMYICNPPTKSGKIKCCHLANIEYFLSFYSRFVPAEMCECCHLANIMQYIRRCLQFYRILYCAIISAPFWPSSWNILVIQFVSNFYNYCALSLHIIQWKNDVSILVNGWVTANYSVLRPSFCPPSSNF